MRRGRGSRGPASDWGTTGAKLAARDHPHPGSAFTNQCLLKSGAMRPEHLYIGSPDTGCSDHHVRDARLPSRKPRSADTRAGRDAHRDRPYS